MSASYQLNTVDSSINIHINSGDATNYVGVAVDSGEANTSDMIVVLDDVITCDEEQTMALSIDSVEIPITYYNVSNSIKNNQFIFTENDVSTLITLPSQNYTVDDLGSELASILNNASAFLSPYTITYNDRNFKFSINSSNAVAFAFNFGSNVIHNSVKYDFSNTADLFGFNFTSINSSIINNKQSIIAPRPANMNTIPFIFLDTEFSSRGSVITTLDGSFASGVLRKIPVDVDFGDYLVYKSTGNRHTLLVQRKRLHSMRFRLKDPRYNGIDLNGVAFSLTLTVDFIDFSSAGVYDTESRDKEIKMTRDDVSEMLTNSLLLKASHYKEQRDDRNKLIDLFELNKQN